MSSPLIRIPESFADIQLRSATALSPVDEEATKVPFNRPYITHAGLEHVAQAISSGHISGNGKFTTRCQTWLEDTIECSRGFLTHSGTGALEMCALLADIGPGDEVIMPSFTFVTTASAFAVRGGVPVFVDIRPDTLTLDESAVEAAITEKTRAIVTVHYAGFSGDMSALQAIARKHGLLLIEDAAQAVMARHQGRALGSFGELAALSFHETKNLQCGEGGALLVNDPTLCKRAEVVWEKGTNRSAFFRGQVDKYTWMDLGSSFQMSDVCAALLYDQLLHAQEITAARVGCWRAYYHGFAEAEAASKIQRPRWLGGAEANGHIFYLLLPDLETRTTLIEYLRERNIHAVFHYIPLHSSPAGRKWGRAHASLPVTDDTADRLVRLPLWHGVAPFLPNIIDAVNDCIRTRL